MTNDHGTIHASPQQSLQQQHHHQQKKRWKCQYLLLAFFSFLLVIIWTALLVSVIKDKAIPLLSRPKYYDIKSYSMPINEYRQSIPGLTYETLSSSSLENLNMTDPFVALFPLSELLKRWNPDDVSVDKWIHSPAHFNNGKGIPRFDYSQPDHRRLALKYRDYEMPFVLYNVPEVDEAIATHFSMSALLDSFGDRYIAVDESIHLNHFTYYKDHHLKQFMKTDPTWEPPQKPIEMKFDDFLYLSEQAEELGPVVNSTLHYFTISASQGYELEWIRDSFPFFRRTKSLFIVDPGGFKGINCRFGQKGVIATAHYDGGRNFVAMMRGRKRYILLPPNECKNLHILPRGHPSARHSELDWSNMNEMEKHSDIWNAQATEVMLGPGDVLYIPGYWFHYIMSQDASVQCNARSGDSVIGRDVITDCGFYEDGESVEDKKFEMKRDADSLRNANSNKDKRSRLRRHDKRKDRD